MRLNGQNSSGNGFTTLASLVLIAAVLYFAKDVFLPIALASLLSFLLAPLVVRLGRWGLGKTFAIPLVVSLAFALMAVVGWLVASQMIHLANQLPKYQENLRAKIKFVKKSGENGVIAKTTEVVKQLEKDLDSLTSEEKTNAPAATATEEEPKPVPVEVQGTRTTPLQLIANVAGPVIKPIAMAAVVVILVIFMLFQREDLRDRFITLVSGGELNVATQAVDDALQRVSRYLIMQLVVNVTYGLPIGVGLYFIGVPNALLWGVLATLLRFIPFAGPWIAASFPIILAFAIDPGWTRPLLTLGLFIVVELISNNLVEPLLYGASTGISTVALLAAAVFWTWLWGPIGLLLSAPLTVCLMVVGKYVPGLGFFSVLLGSEPVLKPEARFYQRMLAMDEDELLNLSENFLRERPLVDLYDGVVIPALSLAEQDRHKGALAEVRQQFIIQNTRELIEALGESVAASPATNALVGTRSTASGSDRAGEARAGEAGRFEVLCLPARDDADEVAALMLAQLLRINGASARALSAKTLPRECSECIRAEQVRAVCISAVPPFGVTAARQWCRRLKQEFPDLDILVGIWSHQAEPAEAARRLASSCPDGLVTRLADALQRLSTSQPQPVNSQPPTQVSLSPETENPERSPRPLPTEAEPEELFHLVISEMARMLNVPVSMISFINADGPFWKRHAGLPPEFSLGSDLNREQPLPGTEDWLIIEDSAEGGRWSQELFFQQRGIRFCANLPLRTRDGTVVGRFFITDTAPHRVSEEDRRLLGSLLARLMEHLESRELQEA